MRQLMREPRSLSIFFCVPDYKAFVEPHIDQKFGRCFKEQWTQLCFRFQAVTPSEACPNCVEMHYRAYAQDEVFEIIDSDKRECGKGSRKCVVKWFPEKKGIYRLRSLPLEKIILYVIHTTKVTAHQLHLKIVIVPSFLD